MARWRDPPSREVTNRVKLDVEAGLRVTFRWLREIGQERDFGAPWRLGETGPFIRFGLTTHVLHACNFGGVVGSMCNFCGEPTETRRVRGGSVSASLPAQNLEARRWKRRLKG
ncbi:hypothetical protein Aoc01nite_56280 [Actinoplanes octamycinicus]|nr:hypothetical protein Aoc01nite_56280 [Actinoplanes octamycinicus]